MLFCVCKSSVHLCFQTSNCVVYVVGKFLMFPTQTVRLVSNGGVVGTEWERDGSGDGHSLRDKPPPPGCLERMR